MLTLRGKEDEMHPLEELAAEALDYKHVVINLRGLDGNAYNLIGTGLKGLRKARAPKKIQDIFIKQATSGDYNNVIQTLMRWFTVDFVDNDTVRIVNDGDTR